MVADQNLSGLVCEPVDLTVQIRCVSLVAQFMNRLHRDHAIEWAPNVLNPVRRLEAGKDKPGRWETREALSAVREHVRREIEQRVARESWAMLQDALRQEPGP